MNKKDIPYIIWMAALGIFGYGSYKYLTSVGASKAYNKIVKDLDNGDTCVMEKPNGEVILVRKIKVEE